MVNQQLRKLNSDPVPRQDLKLPPLINAPKAEGVSSSKTNGAVVEVAKSALSGLKFAD